MCQTNGGERIDNSNHVMKNDSLLTKCIANLGCSNLKLSDEAFNCLVEMKADALPALVNVMEGENPKARYLAVAAISSIGDSSVADIVYKYLDDKDEKVRAWSAVSLKRMNDPRALSALLKTIDDYPDEAHFDQTLSTYALIQWGEEVLPRVIDLLNAPNHSTRIHAFSIIKKIVFNLVKTNEKWEEVWRKNGSYEPKMAEFEREICVQKWRNWLQNK
jgi:HEAT repeats